MSIKKYTNVDLIEIHSRLIKSLGISHRNKLAEMLGITAQALKNREDRGVNRLDDIKLLCSKEGIDTERLFAGMGVVAELSLGYRPPKFSPRAAALAGYFDGLDEEDKKALERIAFTLAQSKKKLRKAG